MQDIYEVRYQMFRTVAEMGRQNMELLVPFPAITQEFAALTGFVAEIASKDRLFGTVTAGKTRHKADIEAELITQIIYLAGPLFSYAFSTKNAELQAIADICESDLINARDTQLAEIARNIISAANLNILGMADRGIVQQDITDAEDLVIEYESAMDNKEYSFGKRKSTKEEMVDIIGKAQQLLENQLDKDMQIFRKKNPALLSDYEAARVVKNIGVMHEPEEETVTPPNEPATPPAP